VNIEKCGANCNPAPAQELLHFLAEVTFIILGKNKFMSFNLEMHSDMNILS